MDIKEYYSRSDVQKELFRLSKDREVQAWFGNIRGRRPEIVNFEGDVKDLVKQGMTSFHVSEERWGESLKLEAGLSKKELDKIRIGWDLIIDLDSKNLNFSLIAGDLIIEALKFHDIKNYSLKFSGNHGVHIGIPFEAFPKEVNNVNIKDYFPDGVRVISEYLKDMIKEFLTAKIMQNMDLNKIAASVNKKLEDIIVNGKFDPFKVVDIDSVLISSRHLFRCAYSINEKSGLVSIPIKDIKDFNIEDAKMENVKVNLKFLDLEDVKEGEARQLMLQAFDWVKKTGSTRTHEGLRGNYGLDGKRNDRVFEMPKSAVKADYFPPCILKLMNGVKEDGRKRSIFILVNFLLNVGWKIDDVEKFLIEWNKKNYEQLREGYIKAQISWFKKQNKIVLPPNCDNLSYYKSMGIKCENSICEKCRNPVNYTIKMVRNLNIKKKNL